VRLGKTDFITSTETQSAAGYGTVHIQN